MRGKKKRKFYSGTSFEENKTLIAFESVGIDVIFQRSCSHVYWIDSRKKVVYCT